MLAPEPAEAGRLARSEPLPLRLVSQPPVLASMGSAQPGILTGFAQPAQRVPTEHLQHRVGYLVALLLRDQDRLVHQAADQVQHLATGYAVAAAYMLDRR